jgi:predicted signal transduction protein with EAL and GGDEF domain
MGVAVWQPGLSGEDVLKSADAALYRAKQDGKGHVCADAPPPARATVTAGGQTAGLTALGHKA